jgi:hypothetical protein
VRYDDLKTREERLKNVPIELDKIADVTQSASEIRPCISIVEVGRHAA